MKQKNKPQKLKSDQVIIDILWQFTDRI